MDAMHVERPSVSVGWLTSRRETTLQDAWVWMTLRALLPEGRRMARALLLQAVALLLSQLWGCASGAATNLVEGSLQPSHFQFVTVVPKRGRGAGGWRAACVHAFLRRDSGDSFVCKFGVEMPLENGEGPISTPLAQRVSADCANQAAYTVFRSLTPATPLGLACETFKSTYESIINRAIAGAHATRVCHARTRPVEAGP